nr:DUF3800 domain-containing protein [Tepidiforma sp.]
MAFVDESGDGGFRFDKGSSRFFTVAVVLFLDERDALACQRALDSLARELGMANNAEFHFRGDSHQRRLEFLRTVGSHRFSVSAFSLDKQKCPVDSGYRYAPSLMKNVAKIAFENLNLPPGKLRVVFDSVGDKKFRAALKRYLNKEGRLGEGVEVAECKGSRSDSDRLLQLADYCAGIANRKALGKRGDDVYYREVEKRFVACRVWGPPGQRA